MDCDTPDHQPGGAPPAPPDRPPALMVRPRRRGHGHRLGPLLIILGVMVGLMGGLSMLAWNLLDQPRRPQSVMGAELFVRRICLGDEGEPGAEDDDALSGYARAFDMLSKDVRAELSFASFCEDFEVLRERFGPVQRIEQRERRRDQRRRLVRYFYELYMGNPEAPLDQLKVYSLDLMLLWVKNQWVVSAYRLHPSAQTELR